MDASCYAGIGEGVEKGIKTCLWVILLLGLLSTVSSVYTARKASQQREQIKTLDILLLEQQLLLQEFRVQAVERGHMTYDPRTETYEWVTPTE